MTTPPRTKILFANDVLDHITIHELARTLASLGLEVMVTGDGLLVRKRVAPPRAVG